MQSPFASVAPYPDCAGRGLKAVFSSSKRSAAPIARKELALSSWDELPLPLWHAIFELIGPSPNVAARRDMFAVVGVCRSWRSVAYHHFFLRPWHQPSDIVHPLQLLRLSERAVFGGLLQCFVRREQMPQLGLGCSRYSLFLCTGGDPEAPSKFLLAALQTSRRMMTVHLDKECAGRPIARVHCSLLQLSYRAVTTGACPLPFVDELTRPVGRDSPSAMERALTLPLPGCAARTPSSGGEGRAAGGLQARLPPVLAQCKYQLRLKGFMRPRRMQVTLPHPAELACFDVDAAATVRRLASVSASCPLPPGLLLPTPLSSSGRAGSPCVPAPHGFKRSTTGNVGAALLSVHRGLRVRLSGASVMAAATSAPAGLDAAADAALDALNFPPPQASGGSTPAGCGAAGASGGAAGGPRLPLGLRNKPPHWNHNLRCHCLNFHGRVKEASVKNYQLVATRPELAAALVATAEAAPRLAQGRRPPRTARAVTMQFGKVDEQLFALDYNPTFMSGLQAFCIALTNFDSKLIL